MPKFKFAQSSNLTEHYIKSPYDLTHKKYTNALQPNVFLTRINRLRVTNKGCRLSPVQIAKVNRILLSQYPYVKVNMRNVCEDKIVVT
jgi:hypothetical protein